MITEIERKELRKLFQGFYADDVLNILKEKKQTNRNSKPYSLQYIRMVFQGVRKSIDIETAIWELASARKEELKKKESQIRQIIKRS